VNRIQRIDQHPRAGEGQSGGDDAFAEPDDQCELGLAGQGRFREPGGKRSQPFFVDHDK
jgi:hypothetical protein